MWLLTCTAQIYEEDVIKLRLYTYLLMGFTSYFFKDMDKCFSLVIVRGAYHLLPSILFFKARWSFLKSSMLPVFIYVSLTALRDLHNAWT